MTYPFASRDLLLKTIGIKTRHLYNLCIFCLYIEILKGHSVFTWHRIRPEYWLYLPSFNLNIIATSYLGSKWKFRMKHSVSLTMGLFFSICPKLIFFFPPRRSPYDTCIQVSCNPMPIWRFIFWVDIIPYQWRPFCWLWKGKKYQLIAPVIPFRYIIG